MFTSSNCSAPIKVINTHILFPQDWYSYIYPNLWLPGIHRCAVAPLFNLSAYEILKAPLPDGDYIFYWVIDDKINDIPSLTWKDRAADIPSTIQGVLTARLDRLEKETKRILQEASGEEDFLCAEDIFDKISSLLTVHYGEDGRCIRKEEISVHFLCPFVCPPKGWHKGFPPFNSPAGPLRDLQGSGSI